MPELKLKDSAEALQLMNDTSASGKGYFVGDKCVICSDANWQTASKSLK